MNLTSTGSFVDLHQSYLNWIISRSTSIFPQLDH